MKIAGIILLALLVLAGIFLLYAKYRIDHIADKKDLQGSVDKQMEKFILDGRSYGMVIGIYKNGRTYIKGYGKTEKDGNLAPDSTSVFELASSSKLFTTATLQLLADNKELSLDQTIQSILQDRVQLPAPAQHTTLRHLATHLSGFPSLPASFIAKMKDESNPYKDLVTQDIYDYLQHCNEKKADGTFEYSNFGMGLLGHLLKLKTGTKYESLVKQRLLNALDMNNTFVSIDSSNRQKIVQGYDENGNKSPVWKDDVLTGAGSFLSDATDMVKFIKANLPPAETTISASLINTHAQQLSGQTGLGWILPGSIDRFMGNKDLLWHNGMAGGYASFIAIDKTNNYGLIILSNKADDVTALGMKLCTITRTQSWKG